jgi:sugar lactone lactonase YvrE
MMKLLTNTKWLSLSLGMLTLLFSAKLNAQVFFQNAPESTDYTTQATCEAFISQTLNGITVTTDQAHRWFAPEEECIPVYDTESYSYGGSTTFTLSEDRDVIRINLSGIARTWTITPSSGTAITHVGSGIITLNFVNISSFTVAGSSSDSYQFSELKVKTEAPAFDTNPFASAITSNSFTLETDIDEAGTIYYVIVADGAAAPTSAEVKAGTASGGGAAIKSANATVSSGGFTYAFSATGLTSETAYDVYVVAEDGEGAPNLQTSPTKVDVTTTQFIAPVFENSTPSAVSITSTGFTLEADLDKAGTIYYVVVADEATAPTAAEVKAGTGNGGAGQIASGNAMVSTGDFIHAFSLTGLTKGANYDVYVVAEDDESTPNLQTTPTKIDVTTLPATHLNFDGTNDNVSIPHNSEFDFSIGTVEAWVRISSSTNSNKCIVAKRTGLGNNTSWSLHINDQDNTIGIYNGTIFSVVNTPINVNEWYHISFVLTSTSTEVFKNGVSAGTMAAGINTSANASIPVTIGHSGGSQTVEYFLGDIDEVRVWKDARTAAEILADKDIQLVGTETDLVAYYKFNQGAHNSYNGSITSLTDATSNNFDGTLNGFALTGTTSNWAYDASNPFDFSLFENSTPSSASITQSGFTINTDVDRAGIIYYVVLADGAAAPTSAEVKAGTGNSGSTAVTSGNATVSTGDFSNAFSVSGLSGNTTYDVYTVAENDESPPRIQTTPTKIEVATSDTMAPVFENSTPSAASITSAGLTLNTDIDEAGTIYYVVVADAATAPTSAEVKAGTGSGSSGEVTSGNAGVSTGDFSNAFSITGLAGATNYDVYVVAEDDEGTPNLQSAPSKIDVSTLNTAPTFTSTAVTDVKAGSAYIYAIEASDPDGDELTFTAPTLPSWLAFDNSAVLVSTLAGGLTSYGSADGTGAAAQFNFPTGTAVDGSGNIYVADQGNHRIRKITPAGVVTTLAGSSQGFAEGTGSAARFDVPYGVAVDGSGNVYVADASNNRIRKITPAGEVTTFAGSGASGFADGTGAAAQFAFPQGIAIDASGNLFVADANNHRIRKITSAGEVTTLAGSGTAGFAEGTGTDAQFNAPIGLTVDASGNVYVADQNNHRIRKITSAGAVTTLAGSGTSGFANGTGTAAQFNTPIGVGLDASENVYIGDFGNSLIRKITPAGVVTTFAGSTFGVTDGIGSTAQFRSPAGLAIDGSGNIYVAGANSRSIRKIERKPILAGSSVIADIGTHNVTLQVTDGNGGTEQQSFTVTVNAVVPPVFENSTPSASNLTTTGFTLNADIDKAGTIYYVLVADGASAPTSEEVKAGTGSFGYGQVASGSVVVSVADFSHAFSITGLESATAYDVYVVAQDDKVDPDLQAAPTKIELTTLNSLPTFTSTPVTSVNVGDIYSYEIAGSDLDEDELTYTAPTLPSWLTLSDPSVSTFAGSGSADFADGTGTAAEFNYPTGVALDASGNIYVADADNNSIRKITPEGVVTTLAGSGTAGFADGTGTAAQFNFPYGVAVDGSGNVYVADLENHRIRKISPAGVVITLAGSGTAGFAEGTGSAAQFNYPGGIAVDDMGNVFVGDFDNHSIRKITPSGEVTTLAGSGFSGFSDGTGSAAEFSGPAGLSLDASGNVFVADLLNHSIRKITPIGEVTTLAGNGYDGFEDGTGSEAEFSHPDGVSVDASGNVFVADNSNHSIRKITPSGVVTTVAGNGYSGDEDGPLSSAEFDNPIGIAVDASGNIFVGDSDNNSIRKITQNLSLIGTPMVSDQGANNVVLEVSDGKGGTEQQSFTITVINIITWNGTVWSGGTAPTSADDAVIDGDYSIDADGTFDVNNLTINSGFTLTVDEEGLLEIDGDLTNNGSMIVESGSSLITYDANSTTGNNIAIHRNTRYANGKYSFVGTPVMQSSSITEATLGSNVYYYDETESYSETDGLDRWDVMNGELVPARGYTQAFQQEIIFNGLPNTGTVTYTGTYTEDALDVNEGWNLVANPYAAAISVASFLTENDHTSGSVYIWDDNGSNTQRGSNSDYITVNGSMFTTTAAGGQTRYNFHLGSAQGFFVKLDDNTDTDIVFTETMRVTGSNADNNFFRSATLPIARINLTDDKGLFKQAVVGFAEDASETNLNKAYDAQAFNATSDFGLFSMKAGRSLSLNGMPQDWQTIQLQLNAKEAGNYQLSIELEGYTEALYLRDKLTGEVVDLSNEAYSFTTQAGIHTDRFELLSSPSTVLNIEREKNSVFAFDKTLYIQQQEITERVYQLFNMQGKHLLTRTVSSKEEIINLNHLSVGIYLVFDGEKTHKIMLK